MRREANFESRMTRFLFKLDNPKLGYGFKLMMAFSDEDLERMTSLDAAKGIYHKIVERTRNAAVEKVIDELTERGAKFGYGFTSSAFDEHEVMEEEGSRGK